MRSGIGFTTKQLHVSNDTLASPWTYRNSQYLVKNMVSALDEGYLNRQTCIRIVTVHYDNMTIFIPGYGEGVSFKSVTVFSAQGEGKSQSRRGQSDLVVVQIYSKQ